MAIEYEIQSICEHDSVDDAAKYNVIIDGEISETWVTHNPLTVEAWIREIENRNDQRLYRLIIGLKIECTISHQIAIMHLCVYRSCLIYQFRQDHQIPEVLKTFLKTPNYTFVGVGIEDVKQKLIKDHSLEVTKTTDLSELTVHEFEDPDLCKADLKKLTKLLIGKEVDHEKLRMSDWNWDSNRLSNEQVLYASVDGYLSFEIMRQLQAWYPN